jgi:hypothetical protein
MIDLELFKNIMEEARHNPDLLDSYSPNQFKSKESLIEHTKELVNEDSEIVIFGGWYGSILIPAFKHVKKITLIDLDEDVIGVAKNRLFSHYNNVEFIIGDIFDVYRDQYSNCDLFINTSCEHMRPMNEWGPAPKYKIPWWKRVTPTYFVFQSNNMFDIEGHINCVNSMDEFKSQLPINSNIIYEEEINDTRGVRYMLIGELNGT